MLSHKEKCEAMEESYRAFDVEALKNIYDKAKTTCGEAKGAYLIARDAYHKAYRDIWH